MCRARTKGRLYGRNLGSQYSKYVQNSATCGAVQYYVFLEDVQCCQVCNYGAGSYLSKQLQDGRIYANSIDRYSVECAYISSLSAFDDSSNYRQLGRVLVAYCSRIG